MAGYVYCMTNNHIFYGRYVKIGYTQRNPWLRARELSDKYQCKFEVVWELDVYDPELVEALLHRALHRFRAKWEFFLVDPDKTKEFAEEQFGKEFREIEDEYDTRLNLLQLAEKGENGEIYEPEDWLAEWDEEWQEVLLEEIRMDQNIE